MRHAVRLAPAALALLLAACTPPPYPPDTARLPPGSFGTNEDQDTAAINFGEYAWADTARLYGRPADGARAVASVDYLAGELTTSPRWDNIGADTKLQMLQARADVRRAAGIAPGAPSQLVVNALVAAYAALAAQDTRGALAALSAPVFTLGPQATLQRLGTLPAVQAANVATTKAEEEMFGPGNIDRPD
jgi:hypothetical protein